MLQGGGLGHARSVAQSRTTARRKTQTELARAWCLKTGSPLVDNYRDLGVLAFRGKNADKGALKAFLDRAETGVIEPGSFLIVESLDRFRKHTRGERGWDRLSTANNL
jgi:hypothetical protein